MNLRSAARAVTNTLSASWQPVSSSNLSAVHYDETRHVLGVRFRGGGEYEYFNVPQSVFNGLLGAGSKGKYFHANIKSGYRFKKIA